ncbi:MAG: DUF4349 domain-containing protein [Candidatus Micrarchaeota archaeon]
MRYALLAVLAFMLFFGCAGIIGTESSPSYNGGAVREALAPTYAAGGADYSAQKYVTKEGTITLKVPEGALESRVEGIKSDLESEGADLSNVVYNEYSDRKQYTLTVKVAPSKFESINDMLKEAGEVKGMSVQLEDVTQQYTDLDTRIKNKEVELGRLYKLYNQSDNVSDLLAVEREVTRVETELELLKGQKDYLSSRVERSTITITIYEEKPASSSLTLPLEGLAALFFTAIAAAITLIVGLAGFLLPIAVVVGLVWLAYTKLAGKKKGPKAPEHSKIPAPE